MENKFKIILDAGHGYNTPGKRTCDGKMHEWEFNNDVSLMVRELLKPYKNVEVTLTHDVTGKTDVPLANRTNFANRYGADLFVSIHANAAGNGKDWNEASGVETFVYNTKPEESMELAAKIQKNMTKATGLKDRGVKTADFHVLRETHMTAVLVECGFMSNQKEAELLKTKTHRSKCAKAIAEAIVQQYAFKGKH